MNKKIFILFSISISIVIIGFIYSLIIGYQSSLKVETTNAIKSNLKNSTELTYERLQKLNGISQQIVYEKTVQDLYYEYINDEHSKAIFSRNIPSILSVKQHPYNELLMTAIFFIDDPEEIYFSSISKNDNRVFYKNNIHKMILNNLDNNNSNVNFFYYDNKFYIYRNLLDNKKLTKYGGYVLEVDINYITEYFNSTSTSNIFVELNINDQSLVLNKDENDNLLVNGKNDLIDFSEYHSIGSASETTEKGRLFDIYTSAYANNIFMYRYEYQFINFYILAIILIVITMCSLIFLYIYRNEMAFLDIKVKSLQSQINPHFLNNSFEIINWTARIDGNYEISKMIDALSTVINSSLDRENNRFNSLYKELEIVDSYLFLIQKRYKDKIKIEKEIDETLISTLLPKLTLQPIIENAVKHGIEKIGEGTIYIRVYKLKSTVNIEIENDGAVITKEEEKRIKKLLNEKSQSAHIGINNVNTRIKYIYGKSYGLTIKRLENDNSMSKITLPLL